MTPSAAWTVLFATVVWCAMWTTCVTSPVDYETRGSSALLKRSRRISRTSRGFSRGFSESLKSSDFQQPCSHVGDLTNDVAARAFLATTVFEGKARSRSGVNAGGTYAVTFQVQHVHKDHTPGALRLRSQVRLHFREKTASPRVSACVQNYNYTAGADGPVRANIKRGGKYLVFVSGVGPHNFTVIGEPVFRSKKNLQAVKDVLCRDCVRPVDVWGLRDVTVKVKERLRLVCRCSGNPLPAMLWLKDGQRINATRNTRIQYKKKRSSLLIPRVRVEDAGRYECRAISVLGESMATYATVTVQPVKPSSGADNTTTLWPLVGSPCPIDTYCLNGGTCTYYETVAELVCQCADGFKGQRCESKDVFNRSNSNPQSVWMVEAPTRIFGLD
ncbi:protein vein isoform X2 [Macrosteles quadrilineatus]|uniref:protein vein isoform X2 n=1 Tax=Macrosteles quadrilineatus TaxID=74068 RepID=UPI0023E2C350|nr:protein vein isoform X2 [Macrosteles quadrilineatus]